MELDKVSEKLFTFLVKPDLAYRRETEEHIPKHHRLPDETKFSIPEENGRELMVYGTWRGANIVEVSQRGFLHLVCVVLPERHAPHAVASQLTGLRQPRVRLGDKNLKQPAPFSSNLTKHLLDRLAKIALF